VLPGTAVTGRGVGRDPLVAPTITLFEQRQLGARVGSFATHDDPYPSRPAGQVEQSGQLGDVTALTHAAISIGGGDPHVFGHELDGVPDLLGDRVADAVLQPATANSALGAQPVQELVRGAGTVAADQQVVPVGCRGSG